MTFEQASQVFADPLLLLEDSTVEDKQRRAAIGITTNWRLMYVVHVEREQQAIRIISARTATNVERERLCMLDQSLDFGRLAEVSRSEACLFSSHLACAFENDLKRIRNAPLRSW